MTTVAQLIAHLQTLPQDAEVRCLEEVVKGYEAYVRWKPLDLEEDTYMVGDWCLEIGCEAK